MVVTNFSSFIIRLFIAVICFVFSCLPAQGQTIDIATVSESDPIGKYMEFTETDRAASLEQVLNSSFSPTEQDVVNAGFSDKGFWLRFTATNSSDIVVQKLLRIQKPLQDSITLYALPLRSYEANAFDTSTLHSVDFAKAEKKQQIQQAGFMVNEADKTFSGASHYFAIQISPGETKQYYLKTTSKYGKSYDMQLITEMTYRNKENIELIVISLIIGALLTIAIYNFFLGLGLKDNTYFYYAIGVVSSIIVFITVRGFFKLYILDQSPLLQKYVPIFIIASGPFTLGLFCIKFLDTKRFSPSADYLLKGLLAFLALSVVYEYLSLAVFDHYVTNKLVAIGVLLFGFIALYAGLRVRYKGNRFARFFIYAWVVYCIGIVTYVLTLLAWIPINSFTNNAYAAGSVIEVILLSFALADRYNTIKKEKELLNEELIGKDVIIAAKKGEIIALMNESLQQLKNKEKLVKNLKRLSKTDDSSDLKSILAQLRSDSFEDSKSILIKENIENYHSEFITRLKATHPDLTKTDIEMASFARLELSRKEIANLRGVSQEAVKSARARLKKKIAIPTEISLDDYFKQL